MGGLIAREMMLRGYYGGHAAALITLGTPNLGYPYLNVDDDFRCKYLAREMSGNFRNATPGDYEPVLLLDGSRPVAVSNYLAGLTLDWGSFGDVPDVWLAAAGTFCDDPVRLGSLGTKGCTNGNPLNDGVVCDDSAEYKFDFPHVATNRWPDPLHIQVHGQVRPCFAVRGVDTVRSSIPLPGRI